MKEAAQLSSKKILLVDDDTSVLEMCREVLAPGFKTIHTAPDGEVGLRIAISELPDLIITGIMMPNLNGLDFIKQLKKSDDTKSIPIIVLSGLYVFEDKVFEAGADLFMNKANIMPDDLLLATKKLLGE